MSNRLPSEQSSEAVRELYGRAVDVLDWWEYDRVWRLRLKSRQAMHRIKTMAGKAIRSTIKDTFTKTRVSVGQPEHVTRNGVGAITREFSVRKGTMPIPLSGELVNVRHKHPYWAGDSHLYVYFDENTRIAPVEINPSGTTISAKDAISSARESRIVVREALDVVGLQDFSNIARQPVELDDGLPIDTMVADDLQHKLVPPYLGSMLIRQSKEYSNG